MVVPIPPSGVSSHPGSYLTPVYAADSLESWASTRQDQTNARIRLPLVLGAQRIGLSDRRIRDLERERQEARDRLLNLPGWSDPAVAKSLEERVARLDEEMHRERLALWKDLLPLAEKAGDAAIDSLRVAWLNELTRTLDGDRR